MDAISPVLAALAFFLSLVAAFFAARTAAAVRELQDRFARLSNSSSALLTKRVESMDSKLEEFGIALGELAQKVKMQRVRTAANHIRDSKEAPDPHTNPDEWRSYMNDKLARARLGA